MDETTAGLSRVAELTAAFYAWEERGRGWQVSPYPVVLEPPFRPFALPFARSDRIRDDARKASALESWFRRLAGQRATPEPEPAGWEVEEPEPRAAPAAASVVEIQASLSPDEKVTAETAEHFLLNLRSCSRPVAFEAVGTASAITIQIACSASDAPHIQEQLRAYFADVVLVETAGFLKEEWQRLSGPAVIADFGLSQEFMRPLRTFARFDADPLIGITGALSDLAPGELGLVQVLFDSVRAPWAASIMRSVTDVEGEPFFVDAPELVKLAEEKTRRPLFAAVVRVATRSASRSRSMEVARRLGAALGQVGHPTGNDLVALDDEDYPSDVHVADVLARQTRRSGFLLNSEELVSLVHLPSAAVRVPRLKRDERRTKAAPVATEGHALILGQNSHGGRTRTVSLAQEFRLRHTHVIGASGTGKSTLLLSLIAQDMALGNGIAVLDPHGDLIDAALARVPDDRVDDVILVDPADVARPVGFNILSAHSELEKTLLSSDLVSVFRRLSTSWGDQMTSVLSNAVLAFLESDRGGTLADLRRFLVEADFRKEFLETVRDREVVYYWQKEFPLLSGRPQAPLLTRLDTFLRPKLVRAMVSQRENRLDFAAMMNEGKILFVKLAQGAIGEENAALLGTLFVAKLHQLALGRQELAEADRRPFLVYMDEFQHFVTASMATLLTGARKYRLGLVLAHQELRQLWNQDKDVAGAVLANPATRIAFRVGDDDAKKLEQGFSLFKARDLQNLGVGQAVCRIDRADWDFSLTTEPLPAMDVALERGRRETVVARSRERYGAVPTSHEPANADQPVAASGPEPRVPPRQPFAARAASAETQAAPVSLPTPTSDVPAAAVDEAPALGRGGAQHKYMQELIRRWADANGWRAMIEKPILDGLGSVDISLERDGRSIACEVSVHSKPEYELANIHKCLAAGFDHVLSIVLDRRSLAKVEKAVSAEIGEPITGRVHVLAPECLFDLLSALAGESDAQDTTVRGYKVRVKHRTLTQADAGARNRTVMRTVVDSLKRMRAP